jgi:hypothetical protein
MAPPASTSSTSVTKFISSLTPHVRLALLSSVLQAIILISLEGIIITLHRQEVDFLVQNKQLLGNLLGGIGATTSPETVLKRAKSLTVYYAIFIVGQIFQLVLCIDAVWNKNTIQVIGLAVFNFITFVYSAIQIIQAQNLISDSLATSMKLLAPGFEHLRSRPYAFTVAGIMLFFALSFAVQAWKLYKEFGWSIFKKIGADLRMRKMYMIYQIFIMILKFDLFMLLAFSTQWLVLLIGEAGEKGGDDYTQVIIHSVVSLGGSFVTVFVAYYAIKTESKVGMFFFFGADLATMGYFIHKLIVMQKPFVTPGVQCRPGLTPEQCDRYDGSRNFFTLFLSMDLLLGIVTLLIAIMAYRNFDKGLKQHLSMQRNDNRSVGEEETHQLQDANTKRWTID